MAGSFTLGLTVLASEFPDSWTWDNEGDARAQHAKIEGKPMPDVVRAVHGGHPSQQRIAEKI